MTRRLMAVLGFALLAGSAAQANDSAFTGAGGTPKLLKGEHRFIAMQSEKVVLVADDKFYDTTVDFVFRNDGPATTVTMGFPEGNFGDSQTDAKKSGFVRFATYVDGRKVPATRKVLPQLDEEDNDAYWLKTVHFGRGQTRKVRVAYRSPMGGMAQWGLLTALSYSFTGQNWKGLVERSDLEIHVKSPGLWMAVPMLNRKPFPINFEAGKTGAIFHKTWRHWQAQAEFMFGLTQAIPFWMIDKNTLAPASLTTDIFHVAKTFRVGPKPAELPLYSTASPDAFALRGTTYVSLSHFKSRLGDFADNLKAAGKGEPDVDLKWDAPTQTAVLLAGKTTLKFRIGSAQLRRTVKGAAETTSTMVGAPIVLHGDYNDSTLYVPLTSVAQVLGLQAKSDPTTRILEINRGIWQ